MRSDIQDQFNRIARQYDQYRRKFIPCFDDFYEGSARLAAALAGSSRNILDLGAGTGLLTMFFIPCFPEGKFLLTDIAGEMLGIARQRFAGMPNVSFLVSDYTREIPPGNFDLVISALSLHHLEDAQKEALFLKIHERLPEGGYFLNCDQFSSEDGTLDQVQNALWIREIENSGMPPEEIARWQERRKLDRECSVSAETVMLKRSGFAMAECLFHFGKFAVIAARKALSGKRK